MMERVMVGALVAAVNEVAHVRAIGERGDAWAQARGAVAADVATAVAGLSSRELRDVAAELGMAGAEPARVSDAVLARVDDLMTATLAAA